MFFTLRENDSFKKCSPKVSLGNQWFFYGIALFLGVYTSRNTVRRKIDTFNKTLQKMRVENAVNRFIFISAGQRLITSKINCFVYICVCCVYLVCVCVYIYIYSNKLYLRKILFIY